MTYLLIFPSIIALGGAPAFADEFSGYPDGASLGDPPAWETPIAPPPTPSRLSGYPPTVPGWAEAEPVEMIVGRVQISLATAGGLETDAADALRYFESLNGPEKRTDHRYDVERAEALTGYALKLQAAADIYGGAVAILEEIADSDSASGADEAFLAEIEGLVLEVETTQSQQNAGCWIDEPTCDPPSADQLALLDELADLQAMYSGSGSDSLDPGELLATAKLLQKRALLGVRIARIAGVKLIVEGTTPREADGSIKRLAVPKGLAGTGKSTGKYTPRSPFVD